MNGNQAVASEKISKKLKNIFFDLKKGGKL